MTPENQTREIASYLQKTAELLSQHTNMAVFLAAPRFDHDYVSTSRSSRWMRIVASAS